VPATATIADGVAMTVIAACPAIAPTDAVTIERPGVRPASVPVESIVATVVSSMCQRGTTPATV